MPSPTTWTWMLFLSYYNSFALCAVHRLLTSSFTTPHLYALQFNDKTAEINTIQNFTAHGGHPWIALSDNKAALYAGEPNGWASYAIDADLKLKYVRSVALQGTCKDSVIPWIGTTYVIAQNRAPFAVYGAPYSSCGNVMTVDRDGQLAAIAQNITYNSDSSVHGMAIHPDGDILYSADIGANGIWAHAIDRDSGLLKILSFTPSGIPGAGPRHVSIHPDGRYLYAVCETNNLLAVYGINKGIGADKNPLTFTGLTYSLVPQGANASQYKADEVLLSKDGDIVYATTRYRDPSLGERPDRSEPKHTTRFKDSFAPKKTLKLLKPGYITAILLTPKMGTGTVSSDGTVGPGYPVRRLFQVETTTSGGAANAIIPASWANDWFAITDSEIGTVEIWQVTGLKDTTYNGELGQDTASPANGQWKGQNWISTGSKMHADASIAVYDQLEVSKVFEKSSTALKGQISEPDTKPALDPAKTSQASVTAKAVATWIAPEVEKNKGGVPRGKGTFTDSCCTNAIWWD